MSNTPVKARLRSKYVVVSFLLLLVIGTCFGVYSRNPNARKQRLMQSAERYFERGDYQAASIQLRRAIQIDEHFSEAHYRLALAYLRLRDWQGAYRSLQKCLSENPNHVPARLELARLELTAKQIAKAQEDAESVINKDPNNFDARLLLGQIAFVNKDYDQALRQFEVCQRLTPGNPLPFYEAAETYSVLKQTSKAVQALQDSIHADKTYVPAYLVLAHFYQLQGDSQLQLATLRTAIDANPAEKAPYIAAATFYVKEGKTDLLPTLFAQLRRATKDNPATLLTIGEFYFGVGDVQRAQQLLNEALSRDSKNAPARRRLIEIDLNQREWDAAEKLDAELLKQEPGDPMGRLFQARLQFVQGARTKAISSLEQLVHDNPDLALPKFYLGVAYATQGESARAISTLNDTVQQDPNFIWADIGLAELYLQQQSPKLALDFANKALNLNPNFVPAMLLQANVYTQLGDYNSAENKLRILSAGQPNNPTVLEADAVLSARQKRYTDAEQQLESALRIQPDNAPAMQVLVEVYGAEKRSIEQIIQRVQQQITLAPKQSSFYEILGDAYLFKRDLNKAESAFKEAIAQNQSTTEARVQLVRLYTSQGRTADALQNAQTLLASHPDFLNGYILLGSLYEQQGNIQQAQKTYQDALERNDDFAAAMNNLAWLYCENGGNLDLALSLAQRAKSKLPNEPSISDTLAWIQYHKGLYSSASNILEPLTQQSPQNATYLYHLGMTRWKEGRPDDARRALQRALELKISSRDAEQAKQALAAMAATPS